MNNEYNSLLKFKGYKVAKIDFNINEEFKQDLDKQITLDVDLNAKNSIDNATNSLKINLCANIFKNYKEENKPFNLNVEISGFFEYEECTNDEELQSLIKTNAVAILYPYLRSFISIITCNSGFSTIILPTINVSKLLKAKENEK